MNDTAQLHAEQLQYWDGAGGQRWVAQQDRRDLTLRDFAKPALDKAQVRPGEAVLDVGCGCGETSALLAQAVGPQGKVVAVDVSSPILAEARAQLAAFDNVETILADAATYPLPAGAFDLMFSRFGVMFFGDPTAAFAHIRRALKPDGRLVFACWRSPGENGWMTAPFDAVTHLLPPTHPPAPETPGPLSFGDPARVTRKLTAAGFTAPRFDKVDKTMDLAAGEGVQGAVRSATEMGPVARVLDSVGQEVRAQVAEALAAYFEPMLKDGEVNLPAGIWIVSARVANG